MDFNYWLKAKQKDKYFESFFKMHFWRRTHLMGIIIMLLSALFIFVPLAYAQTSGPLPDECGGVNPGGPVPSCCVRGYVYYHGTPISGTAVTVESPFGVTIAATTMGMDSDQPYYGVDLELLQVTPGQFITVSATINEVTARTVYQVMPDGQQVDVIFAHNNDDWWNLDYAYRRVLTITTDGEYPVNTLIKIDDLDLETLIRAGKVRSDHNDLRIARRVSEGNWEEIARIYYTNWDLEFKLVASIPPGTDTSYYLYYGNPNADTPPSFNLPQGWWVDMYHDKWWSDYGGTWEFNQTMNFDNVCELPLDHDERIGTNYDESDKFRGRIYIPYTGAWTFYVYTNDGYRVYIGGEELERFDGYDVNNRWVEVGTKELKAGWHRMRLRNMWVSCGAWKFNMEGPSFANQAVPANYFQMVDDFQKITGVGEEESSLSRYPPIATIHTIYPHPAIVNRDIVTLYGSAMDNDEDGVSISQYLWRSDIDGILGAKSVLTYPASALSLGTHTLYFKARDNEGVWSNELATTLQVIPNALPQAAFVISPTSGYTKTIFTFDASNSSDDEDSINNLKIRWDWEDDGVYDTSWSITKTITHSYVTTGTHIVRLEVQDTATLTDTITRTVTVSPPVAKANWLFMLYLDGDNNLYKWFEHALKTLEQTVLPGTVHIVALLDGPGNANTWRYYVQPDGKYIDGMNRWFMGELDMSNPHTLSDFVNWARLNYPAKYTYLAVADHGRGTTGIAWDETSGEDAFIGVGDLKTALQDVSADGDNPIDVLHYDACLMAMLENAYQVQDYARYLVASENLGWSVFAYDVYASQMLTNTTPLTLSMNIVDEYFEALPNHPRTISALDLEKIDLVSQSVDTLAETLLTDLSTYTSTIATSRDAVQKFDSQDYFTLDVADEYVDLYDLARLLKLNIADNTIQSAAQGVMNTVDAVVIAEHHASGNYQQYPRWNLENAYGLSIYFPPDSKSWDYDEYMEHIFTFTTQNQWDEFLAKYYELVGPNLLPPVAPGVPPVLHWSDGISITKSVTPAGQVEFGNMLTYTLVISAAPGTHLQLYDAIEDTTFLHFLERPTDITHTARIPGGTLYLGGLITGTLDITQTAPVTVSFVTQLGVPSTFFRDVDVVNQACVYPVGGGIGDCLWSNMVKSSPVWGYGVFLPLVLRNFPPPAPDFSLTISPDNLVIEQGETALYTVNIVAINSFTDPVSLTVTGVPLNTSAVWEENTTTPTALHQLWITTTLDTPVSDYILHITGKAGDLTHTANVNLQVERGRPTGDGVVLYEQPNYEGNYIVLTESDPNLVDNDFNDKASSLQIVGTYTVTLYGDVYYGGRFSTFTESDPDLGNEGIGNAQASSVWIEVP